MSQLFKRSALLEVEVEDGATFENGVALVGLRTKFNVDKSIDKTLNRAGASVWNISESTLGKIKKDGGTVRLSAGYENEGTTILCVGKISQVYSERSGADIVTEFEFADGVTEVGDTTVTLSFDSDTPLMTLFNKVALAVGLPLVPVNPITDFIYEPLTFNGSVRSALDLLCEIGGLSWWVDNGAIWIWDKVVGSLASAEFLTPANGLVDTPKKVYKKKDEKAKAGDSLPPDWTLKTLLRPQIVPGSIIRVECATVDAFMVVDFISHTGDTHTDSWESYLECRVVE